MKLFVLITLTASLLVACGTSKNTTPSASDTQIISIVHGTSFGHCRGYCIRELVLRNGDAVFAKTSRDEAQFPTEKKNIAFSKTEWEKLVREVNIDEFFKLNETYGCPDCADGGAEFIEISTSKGTKRVTIEYRADQPELGKILSALRKISEVKVPEE
ncbi:hypothetical protein [Fluviicola sp.]|uniref:hypothetical protein n=1 Tax=Fluviicola sp. TaxID=1917219 RepID=UPI0031E2199B